MLFYNLQTVYINRNSTFVEGTVEYQYNEILGTSEISLL